MHIPRKRFGQHFLHDDIYIRRIIAALAPMPSDHLVEIGPGCGALTLPVLRQVKRLEAVELDRDLIPELERRAQDMGKLIVHQGDVLDFNFAKLKTDERMLRVFGNLPYNISTPLIFHLLTFTNVISDMIFMLQKEVAERLAAGADTEHYGRLSVMVQYHCQVELLFDVPPQAFSPPPKVDSSIIRLVPYTTYPHRALDYQQFASVVKHAFLQRRKTLRNSLKSFMDDEAWSRIMIKSNLRAEDLTVEDFVALSNAIIRT